MWVLSGDDGTPPIGMHDPTVEKAWIGDSPAFPIPAEFQAYNPAHKYVVVLNYQSKVPAEVKP